MVWATKGGKKGGKYIEYTNMQKHSSNYIENNYSMVFSRVPITPYNFPSSFIKD